MRHTKHSTERCKTRGLDEDVEQVILDFGHREHLNNGAVAVELRDRQVRGQIDESLRTKARGWKLIITSDEDALITCYRRSVNRRVRRRRETDIDHDRIHSAGADAA